MPSSTKEYLEAFHQGRYLIFLDWPRLFDSNFGTRLDADSILNTLVSEWLENTFNKDDLERLAFLFAMSELESKPLRAYFAYSLITIVNASLYCKVYTQNTSVTSSCTLEQPNQQFLEELTKAQEEFFSMVHRIMQTDKKKLELEARKISEITELMHEMDNYVLILNNNENKEDFLHSSRLSVVKRLKSYLDEQRELNSAVQEEIYKYVLQIKKMQPQQFEYAYLEKMMPLSFLEKASSALTSFIGVFAYRDTSQKNNIYKDDSVQTENKEF